MPRKRTSRLRARKQGGATPYDGDFRGCTVVGGGIEALKPAGSKWATTYPHGANRRITQSNSLSNLFRRAQSKGCVPPEPPSHRRPGTGWSISPVAAADVDDAPRDMRDAPTHARGRVR
jgi:hypothetical protein